MMQRSMDEHDIVVMDHGSWYFWCEKHSEQFIASGVAH